MGYRYTQYISFGFLVLSLSALAHSNEYAVIKDAADRNKCTGENLLILYAVRKAENGPAGNEFGIMNVKARNTNLGVQAAWAAATIVKNRARWNGKGDFIEFLGSRYCPVGAKNDRQGLNRNWIKNVKFWVTKYKSKEDE